MINRNLTRREAIAAFAAATTQAATRLPANQNLRWAVSAGLWHHFKRVPLTEIPDIMKDTSFIGLQIVTISLLPKDSNRAQFLNSIYGTIDGDIDFFAVHNILTCENEAAYVVNKLEPIYN